MCHKLSHGAVSSGDPTGIRTRVTTLKEWCPRPLDHGAANGGRGRFRTLGPLIKSQLLYQLSYTPAALAIIAPWSLGRKRILSAPAASGSSDIEWGFPGSPPEFPGSAIPRHLPKRDFGLGPWCQQLPNLPDKPQQLSFVPPLRGDRFRADPPVRQFGSATRRESRCASGGMPLHRSHNANTSPTTLREDLAALGL